MHSSISAATAFLLVLMLPAALALPVGQSRTLPALTKRSSPISTPSPPSTPGGSLPTTLTDGPPSPTTPLSPVRVRIPGKAVPAGAMSPGSPTAVGRRPAAPLALAAGPLSPATRPSTLPPAAVALAANLDQAPPPPGPGMRTSFQAPPDTVTIASSAPTPDDYALGGPSVRSPIVKNVWRKQSLSDDGSSDSEPSSPATMAPVGAASPTPVVAPMPVLARRPPAAAGVTTPGARTPTPRLSTPIPRVKTPASSQ